MEHTFAIQTFCANYESVKKNSIFQWISTEKSNFWSFFTLFLRKCQIQPPCTPLHGLHGIFLCWPCWVHYMSELLSYGKHMVTIRKIGEIGTFVRAIKYTEFQPIGLHSALGWVLFREKLNVVFQLKNFLIAFVCIY